MQRVINISGGLSSALMTINEYREGDIVLFTDTGREHPKTYKFLNDFEAHEQIQIKRLSLNDSDEAFSFLQAKKRWKAIPNRVKRFCTVELKVKVARRYIRSLGFMEYENLLGFI
jgi:3'-phosphoadenosine 5'-phosphosulfate sulfotransferase (PAPS reductase)/FAD synthetase